MPPFALRVFTAPEDFRGRNRIDDFTAIADCSALPAFSRIARSISPRAARSRASARRDGALRAWAKRAMGMSCPLR